MKNFEAVDTMPESGRFIIVGTEYGTNFAWAVERIGDELFEEDGTQLHGIERFKSDCEYLVAKG
ncbi:hypothetical protein ACRXCV_00490 (plasmid) [Halobacteriovorax sp. GFR7]|uniref:hypothetical protein n=1 Tax=unclassified Halobacteriovorax TaxID=2639665 RepID=UPI003D9996B4